jgi:Mn-dependent DtxR family transcriptional regulator
MIRELLSSGVEQTTMAETIARLVRDGLVQVIPGRPSRSTRSLR